MTNDRKMTMLPAHRIYVGTIGEGLFRSSDAGDSFVRAADGMFVECHVRALAVHPRQPHVLYLGSDQGLFRSVDGAGNWSRVESPLNDKQIWSVLIHSANPERIVVGVCPSAIYCSPDGGQSWSQAKIKVVQECPRIMHTRVTTLVADPHEPDTIWAGVEIDGLFRSRDGGRSFERIGAGLSSQDIHALAIVPENGHPRRLLAATNNDLNLSRDNGETWEPLRIQQALPWPYCRALAQPCGDPEAVLLGNGNGPPGSAGVVARSADGGLTWKAAAMPGLANSTMWNFAVHPENVELIYASSVSGELYRSTDRGQTWEKLAREFGEIRALAWAP
jgi:photosystem II stability/assembly factor-like uncharacterized protein